MNHMSSFGGLQTFWAALLRIAAIVARAISWLSARVIGHLDWQPPSWLAWVGQRFNEGWRYLTADWRLGWIAFIALISSVGGYAWYKSLPQPHYVTYDVTRPALTEYNDRGIYSIKPLAIHFSE